MDFPTHVVDLLIFVFVNIGFTFHGPSLKDSKTYILLTLMDAIHTLIDMVDITLQPCT